MPLLARAPSRIINVTAPQWQADMEEDMREEEPTELRESMRVLLAYLSGDEPLDSALVAWRALRIEESEGEVEEEGKGGGEEDTFLGIDRDTLPLAQQERLAAFMEALEGAP